MDQGQTGAQGPHTCYSGGFVEERDPLEEARCEGSLFFQSLMSLGAFQY